MMIYTVDIDWYSYFMISLENLLLEVLLEMWLMPHIPHIFKT